MVDLVEFVHRENMRLYKKQLAKETNEARRNQLIRLLAMEEAEAQGRAGEPNPLRQLVGRCSAALMAMGYVGVIVC